MPSVDEASGAEARVFTFKEGLLSAVAHDLELAVGRLRVDFSEQHVTATFALTSLHVLHAVVAGKPEPALLSPRDIRSIEQNMAEEVLAVRAHPEARFESSEVSASGSGYVVQGTLSLAGRSEPVTANVRRDGGRFVAEVLLDQRRFGIKPYSAMLGTLKLKPEIKVVVSVPA